MRTMLTLAFTALLAGTALPAAAQQPSPQAQSSGTQITGTVTEVDQNGTHITIDGQEYIMQPSAGTAMTPSPGDQISLFYREEGGQRVITRIGQKQQ